MSDDVLKLIPKDPEFVPTQAAQVAAISALEKLLPEGEMCEAEVYDTLTFIDQGENLEAVVCPSCGRRTAIDFGSDEDPGQAWWYQLSDELEDNDPSTMTTEMPNCEHRIKVVEIGFEWPAGFARFELSIYNPNTTENLNNSELRKLEEILSCELLQVRAHY
jgi:hypothetical protein